MVRLDARQEDGRRQVEVEVTQRDCCRSTQCLSGVLFTIYGLYLVWGLYSSVVEFPYCFGEHRYASFDSAQCVAECEGRYVCNTTYRYDEGVFTLNKSLRHESNMFKGVDLYRRNGEFIYNLECARLWANDVCFGLATLITLFIFALSSYCVATIDFPILKSETLKV